MKKTFLITVLSVSILVQLCGLLYALTGSTEMFPTDEQEEKVRIFALILVIAPLCIEFVCVGLYRRGQKK